MRIKWQTACYLTQVTQGHNAAASLISVGAQVRWIRHVQAHSRCSHCSQLTVMCVQLLDLPVGSEDPKVLLGWLQTAIQDLSALRDHLAAVTPFVVRHELICSAGLE